MRNLLTVVLVLGVIVYGLITYRSSGTQVDLAEALTSEVEAAASSDVFADAESELRSPGLDVNEDGIPDDFDAYLGKQSGDVKNAAKQLSQAYFAIAKEFLEDASTRQHALSYTRSLACLSSVLAGDIAARFEVLGALLNTQEKRSLAHAIDMLITTGITIDFTGSGNQFGAIVTRNPTREIIKLYDDIDEFQIEAIAAYCDFESEIARGIALKRFSEDTGIVISKQGDVTRSTPTLPVPKLSPETFTLLEAPDVSVPERARSPRNLVLETASDINQILKLEGNCWFYSYAVSDVAVSLNSESVKLSELQKIRSEAKADRCIKE